MSSPLRICLCGFALLFVNFCSSPYLKNRGRDGLDILTVELQTQSYGASLRAGPVKAGLTYKSADGKDLGLRGGDIGRHNSADFTAFFIGADYFQKDPLDDLTTKSTVPATKDAEKNLEKPDTKTEPPQPPPESTTASPDAQTDVPASSFLKERDKEFRARSPFGTTIAAQKKKSLFKKKGGFAPVSYYTQIEVTVGIWAGLKVGINPGELLDAVLGIFTLDPFGDDEPFLSETEKALKENPLYDKLTPEQRVKLMEQIKLQKP